MKVKTLTLAIGLGLVFAAPALPQQRGGDPGLLARLEQLAGDCEWKLRNATGGVKGRLSLHHRKLENIIEQLKAGKSVDSKEVDAVLHEHFYG
jgi:hypothetical protein